MIRFVHFLLVFCLIVCVSSCTTCNYKTVQCPAYYNPNFASWFPYHDSETVLFRNAAGTTDTLFIATAVEGGPHSIYGHFTTADCRSHAEISAPLSNILSGHLTLDVGESRGLQYTTGASLAFDSVYISVAGIVDTGLDLQVNNSPSREKWLSHFSVNTVFNGKTYDSLQTLFAADSASAGIAAIDTIYLARGYGIVGFSSYPSHAVWSIQ